MEPDYVTHWTNANNLVEVASELGGITTVDQALAAAQVQATLALAAATKEVALNQGRRPARSLLADMALDVPTINEGTK